MKYWYVTFSILARSGYVLGTEDVELELNENASEQDVLEEALYEMYKLEEYHPMVMIDYIVSEDGEEIDFSNIDYNKYSREYFAL